MALTVAQVLKLRDAGATRVVCHGDDLEVEFGPPATPIRGLDAWLPEGPVRRTALGVPGDRFAPDPEPDVELPPRPRDALETAQSFNGPIPYAEDA